MSESLDLLVPILAILFAGLVVLVPIAGLTLRFVIKPAMEAYAHARSPQVPAEEIRLLEQRLARLEEQFYRLTREQNTIPAPRAVTTDRAGTLPGS